MPAGSAALPGRPRGFALLIVLWFLVLLAATGGWILSTSRSETSLAHNVMAAASAEALADAGVAQAVFHLTADKPDEHWAPDGQTHRISTSKGEIMIKIDDEAAKINPNLASDGLLAALFTVLGADPSRASQLGAAITDWVGKDDKAGAANTLHDRYQEAGLSNLPPHVPITDLDALTHVLGMTPDVMERARPYLTIHTTSTRPDGKFISALVKKAVALAAANLPPGTAETTIGTSPANGMSAGAYRGERARFQPIRETTTQEDQPVATLRITARSKTGGIYVRYAVIRLEPNGPNGYVVLDWQRGALEEITSRD